MFAGHDTSASTFMHGIWMLCAQHPEVIQKLRQEQGQVVAEHGQEMTPEALKAMSYTGAVVNELLRYRPIIGGVPRKALCDFELDGYRIPKDTQLMLHIGHVTTCQSPSISHGPFAMGTFNPDRWLEPGAVNSRAFMPFGGGPRMCLGYPLALMELKLMLALLARRYDWSVALDHAKGAAEEVQWDVFPILRPRGNQLHLRFVKRQEQAA